LDGAKEWSGTMLDSTRPRFPSDIWTCRKHDNFRLPLVLPGGLDGTLQTVSSLNYLSDNEDNRRMCSLCLPLMDRFDVKLSR
jgi:hypothetical protein